MIINCPICETELKRNFDTIEGTVCEDYYFCSKCGYGFEYTYGYTTVYFGNISYSYNYADSEEYKNRILDRIKLETKEAKEKWGENFNS